MGAAAAGSQLLEPVTGVPARIAVRVLGTFEVTVGRGDAKRAVERADWHRVSAERLMKLLLVAPGHTVSREMAAETLWPDADPDSGRANLRKALHFARNALGDPTAIAADKDTLRLDPTAFDIDLDRLLVALDLLVRRAPPVPSEGDGHGEGLAREPGEAVLDLGSRTLLPDDAYEDWLVPIRERLRSRWQVVAMHAARDAVAAGRRDAAHEILERILDQDPADEAAHRLVMELYAAEGRHHAVRRQFELCRSALRAAVDASPSEETEETYRRAERAAESSTQSAVAQMRFVARRRELERIEPLLDRIGAGRSGAVVIRGPAGIGKTRLLQEVSLYARASGWRELAWQAIEPTRSVAFAPFGMHLADRLAAADVETWPEPERSSIAVILPRLGIQPRIPFEDRSALVVALLAAIARLARSGPYLIAIDDGPWLDDASMELVESVVSALPSSPVLVAVTYRDDEQIPARAIQLFDRLRHAGALELRLGPFAERDLEAVVLSQLGGDGLSPELETLLFQRSEGNPLFCLELARGAATSGAIALEHGRWRIVRDDELRQPPETVRQVVNARWKALAPTAAELLRIVAELGAEASYATLAAVAPAVAPALAPAADGGLIQALDSALESGLLVERGAGYAFAHPLFRETVEAASGTARRAGFHMAIARGLAGMRAGDEIADPAALVDRCLDPGLVAEHALRACELGLAEAARLGVAFGFAAAMRARDLFDRVTATALFERSLEAWRRLPRRTQLQFDASSAWMNLAELRMAADDEAGARRAFESAVDAARAPEELADAYDRYIWVPYRHGDFQTTISLCEEGLSRLPLEAAVPRAVLRVRIGWCLGRLHRIDESVKCLEDAVAVLDEAKDLVRVSQALDNLGMMLPFAGRSDEAIRSLERALAIAIDLGDVRLELARGHLAAALTRAGRPAEARPHIARSLELTDQMGNWYLEAVAAWIAAEMEDALGNLDAARELRLRELSLLARIGGNPHNEAFSHAHLAHLARLAGDEVTEGAEAARARELAAADPQPGYAARIEEALTVENWSDLATG